MKTKLQEQKMQKKLGKVIKLLQKCKEVIYSRSALCVVWLCY